MAFLLRRGSPASRLADGPRSALAGLLESPTFELIPLKNALDQAAGLPPGSTVSVTASLAKGIEATIELSASLTAAGFRVIPHLAARSIRDRDQLRDLLRRLRDAGVDRAFVVGGDEEHPGDYADALSLLLAMADLGIGPREIGIGCYPQGHAFIPDDALLRALRDKAPFASYMTTQLCFDPPAIARFIAARRAEGITLPVKIGIPGVAEVPKLMAISARIGVRDTGRFLLKNSGFVGQLLTSGGIYKPTGLLEKLAPLLADPRAGVVDLHVYTFNQVPSTESWRRDYVDALAPPVEAAARA
jgi:methylenetetrahydrofolate reductase (NADPH)